MSANIQLELNVDNKTPEEMHLLIMQKQIDEMNLSMGKVRRKLFSEITEVKKQCAEMALENQKLKTLLGELRNEPLSWVYKKNESLFEVVDFHGVAL